jgi:large subunit ribosomal protein L10
VPNPAKIEEVEKLEKLLKENTIQYLTDHTGLTVAQVNDLRSKLTEAGAIMRIAKNRFMKIARKQAGLVPIDDVLVGPTSWVLANNDPVKPAKVLRDFKKNIDKPQVKGVIVDNQILSLSRFDEIAQMPEISQLQAMFVGGIAAPISGLVFGLSGLLRGFVIALSAIGEKKQAF